MKHLFYLYKFYRWLVCKRQGIKFKSIPYADFSVELLNCGKGTFICDDNVSFRSYVSVMNLHKHSILKIGSNTDIGRGSTISCWNEIVLQKNVLTGPYVFISDHNHKYTDVNTPILNQGVEIHEDSKVIIGEGTWIGTNVVIVGCLTIGKNCVIAANSVVNKNVPDYCVVAGSPARIVKRYNHDLMKWEKVLN